MLVVNLNSKDMRIVWLSMQARLTCLHERDLMSAIKLHSLFSVTISTLQHPEESVLTSDKSTTEEEDKTIEESTCFAAQESTPTSLPALKSMVSVTSTECQLLLQSSVSLST